MSADRIVAGVMALSLVLYVLLAGADFGGGVWDLLAFGPRRAEQRKLIEQAIGPVWEANHVWLILVVVLLFSAFPRAFAAISVSLCVPLTLFLLGVVFRGSAFAFRAYELRGDRYQRRWGFGFSLASIASPPFLGMVVGALASGQIRVEGGVVRGGYWRPWLAPFPVAVGLFALALFAFLAATYLVNEATAPSLREDFRVRAMISGAAVGVFALAAFVLSFRGAPLVREGLTARPWTWPLHAVTAAAATAAFWGLWKRRFALARLAAAVQAALVVLGWVASQYPRIVVPDLTLTNAAANARTLHLLVGALAVGFVLLFPSLYVLYRVFKGERAFAIRDRAAARASPHGA